MATQASVPAPASARDHMPAIFKRLGLLPSYTVEWAWVTGRIIVALGVIFGATLVAQESPAYPLYIGICVVFLGYAAFMAVLLMRRQLQAVFLIGSFMDNALLLFAWLGSYSLLADTPTPPSDLYLILFPFLSLSAVRLGAVLGGIQTVLWLAWMVWSTLHYDAPDSYASEQLPIRVVFLALTVILTLRLARRLSHEQERVLGLATEATAREGEVRRLNAELNTHLVELKATTDRLQALGSAANDAIISADNRGNILSWNQGAEKMFQYTAVEVIGWPLTVIMPERFKESRRAGIERYRSTGEEHVLGRTVELSGCRKDGTEFPVELSLFTWQTAQDQFFGGIIRDITERKRLEGQLQQAQKLEAVGRLASGIAHDFNNLMTPIVAYAELGIQRVVQDHPLREYFDEILNASQRAKELTTHLLTFSRSGAIDAAVFSLNDLLKETDRLIRRTLRESVQCSMALDPALAPVIADKNGIQQVLLNLVVNAGDAMPQGGSLSIQTSNAAIDETIARTYNVPSGDYVLLAVTDTGSGMTQEIKSRLFEPFFTTKEPGKGTGLGLATSYGIVRRNGGHIAIYSELGLGTTVRVYLPRALQDAPTHSEPQPASLPKGLETILMVEDNQAVSAAAKLMLGQLGYKVITAQNGAEALEVASTQHVNLVLTDLIMPVLSGRQLAAQLRAKDPHIRILFMSGYIDAAERDSSDDRFPVLRKPFTLHELATAVRQALEG